VVSRETKVVEMVRDADMESAIHKAVLIERCRATDMRGMGAMLSIPVEIQRPPIDVAFDIFVRIGAREWPAGTAVARRDSQPNTMASVIGMGAPGHSLSRDFPDDADRIDIVLRSSESAAEAAGLSRIWDGEIVIADIPLERPPGR
jgi:hypothetical protein